MFTYAYTHTHTQTFSPQFPNIVIQSTILVIILTSTLQILGYVLSHHLSHMSKGQEKGKLIVALN